MVELMTGEKPGPYTMEAIEPIYPGASDAVRTAVLALRGDGLTLRDSAALAGISYKRAQTLDARHAG